MQALGQELKTFYQQQAETLTVEIQRLKKRNTVFVVSELLTFALVLAAVAAYVSTTTGYTYLYIGALMLVVYVLVRWADVRNSSRVVELEDERSVYQKEQAYHNGDFSVFGDGAQYIDPQHPFSFDMDLFGHDSLFNRINRTITTGGSDVLAKELTEWTCQDVAKRQEEIRNLAQQEPLRTRWMAYGQRGVIDTQKVLAALRGVTDSSSSCSQGGKWLAVLAAIGVWVVVGLSIAGMLPGSVALLWVFLQFGIVFALNNPAFHEVNKTVNRMHKELSIYVALFDLAGVAGEPIRELQQILDGLDRQGNALYRFLSDTFFCYDFWLIRRFHRWQERYLLQVVKGIEKVSHFDALVSMATFRYNEPAAIEAELVESDDVVYEAADLVHPFLGETAVSNDFTLNDGHYYIITGANMAGKSTFLRTIGVNYILARCGMPVFASRFRVSRFALFSSMRTTDDLTQGISYFNAELLRLQQLIAYCQKHERTLIILDEILKGTNSLDKLNGSRLFLENIQRLPVTGVVATHDLELSKMADEYPSRIHNYCFEIALSDHVTYSYKITEGVARNQNATFLLKNIVLGAGASVS